MAGILKIIGVLTVIQGLRAGIGFGLSALLDPGRQWMDVTESAAILLAGLIALAVFRPGAGKLGLDMKGRPLCEKIVYIAAGTGVVAIAAAGLPLTGGTDANAVFAALKSAVVIPIFEELIFRGTIWDSLSKKGYPEPVIYAVTVILFALWHLGYYDVVWLHAAGNAKAPDMGNIMFFKMLTGFAFGVATGLLRWKTKRTYAGILMHALFNIFGR
jgi:membrane protease YdiL (CAAX protease family)